MESELKENVILITGASGGIGRATARAFAAEGASLLLHCHRDRGSATALAAELSVPTKVLQADVSDEDQVTSMFREGLEELGRIDALVVNAGIWIEEETPIHRMTLDQWNKTMAIDLTGAFLTCRGFFRHLAAEPRSKASVVLVASTAGLFGEENHSDYSAAKAAMAHGLTRTLKNEIVRLAPLGRVNCVCPGWVDTPMSASSMDDPEAVGRATATMALQKIATADDIARSIVFLTSNELSGHLSGTILPIAGGMEGRWLHRR